MSGDTTGFVDICAGKRVNLPPAADRRDVVAPRTLEDVEAVFCQWIRDKDPLPMRAVLAAYLANRNHDGDPVWLMIVGGSGVGKTERLMPIAVMPDVVMESSISGPAALLSATAKRERAKNASGGVLRKLPEGGGVLLLKDFTSIIDMHRDQRAEVLAALREVYDGRWDRSVGAEGGRTLTWTGHLGVIAGCTTIIDSAHAVVSTMGTRFVMIRLRGDEDMALSALTQVGRESVMRERLRDVVHGLLEHPPGRVHPVDDEIRRRLAALGNYVAAARSPVDRDQQGEIRLVLDAEAPTRIVKVLAQLWRAAGLLGLERPDAWALIARIGMDSIPKLRREILDVLDRLPVARSTTFVSEAVEHPSRTTRRALEDLTAHRMVRRQAGGDGKADCWELSDQAKRWLDQSRIVPDLTLPVLSGSTLPLKTKSTTDDKTGKVPRGVDDGSTVY